MMSEYRIVFRPNGLETRVYQYLSVDNQNDAQKLADRSGFYIKAMWGDDVEIWVEERPKIEGWTRVGELSEA